MKVPFLCYRTNLKEFERSRIEDVVRLLSFKMRKSRLHNRTPAKARPASIARSQNSFLIGCNYRYGVAFVVVNLVRCYPADITTLISF
jgi:hypothetical protein